MVKKIVMLVLLIPILLCPVLFMAWMFLPVFAGIFLVTFLRISKTGVSGRFVKPALLIAMLAIVIWFAYSPWKRVGASPIQASRTNTFIYSLFAQKQTSALGGMHNESPDRRELVIAIETDRLGLKEVATALEVRQSADDYAKRHHMEPGTADLETAITNLEHVLATTPTPVAQSLMKYSNLEAYVQKASKELDGIEQEATNSNASATQLREERFDLAGRLAQYNMQILYDATDKVESLLRVIFRTDIGSPTSKNSAVYDRSADRLSACQQITIDLARHKAFGIDLSGLVPEQVNGDLLSIKIAQDDGLSQVVDLKDPKVTVEGARQLIISRCLAQLSPTMPVVSSQLWTPFKQISVHWPFPLSSSVTLVLLSPDGSTHWPYLIPVRSSDTESLSVIRVPENSYFFSPDVIPALAKVSDLIPSQSAPHLASLASSQAITVQLLPPYLSFGWGQEFKDYFALESKIGFLFIATITSIVTAVLTEKQTKTP